MTMISIGKASSLSQIYSAYVDSIPQFMQILERQLKLDDEHKISVILCLHFNRSDRVNVLIDETYANETQQIIIEKILSCLRPQDKLICVSQQECWLFLPQLSSDALAVLAVHRLLSVLNLPIQIESENKKNNEKNSAAEFENKLVNEHQNKKIFLHPSIGIACSSLHYADAQELIFIADKAQKDAELNHHQFAMGQTNIDRCLASEERLKLVQKELDDNSLELKYQPKVNLRMREKISVEALVRWPSAHQHKIDTFLLIELSEEFGLIEQLTMQVVNKVFQDVHQWEQQGEQVIVWINLSAQLLSLEHLPQLLSRTLQVWNISATSIGFEITESAFIQNIEHTTELLFQLKNCGFQLAIDDFGTGYSSLAYLRRFPIDEIKIDKMFVQGMTTSIQDKQIVQSIIDLGHNFGLKVVAEGVEDEMSLAMLEKMECDCIQGYLFAYPMPFEEIIPWHQKNK